MKNLNEELNRIGSLMGLKPKLLNEQAQLPRTIIKKVLGGEEPMEAVRKIFNLSDNEASNLATRLERGGVENLGDDFIESLASKTIDDMSQLTSLLKRGGYLGDIDSLTLNILNDPRINNADKITSENYEKIVNAYRKSLDNVPWLKDFTDLKNQLIEDFEMEFAEKFQSKFVISVSDMSDEIESALRSFEDLLGMSESQLKTEIRAMLTDKGKKLSKFFTKSDVDSYVEEAYGIVKQKFSKDFKNLMNDIEAEKMWDSLTLSQKEKLLKETIENITKEMPWGPNPLTWFKRISLGIDGKWSWKTVITKIRNVYFSSVVIQIFRELLRVTNIFADKQSGKDVLYGSVTDQILDGRTWEDFIATLAFPPVGWASSLLAWLKADRDFLALKDLLDTKHKDDLYQLDENEIDKYKFYIRKGKIIYPITFEENKWYIHIPPTSGKVYKQYPLEKGQNYIK